MQMEKQMMIKNFTEPKYLERRRYHFEQAHSCKILHKNSMKKVLLVIWGDRKCGGISVVNSLDHFIILFISNKKTERHRRISKTNNLERWNLQDSN